MINSNKRNWKKYAFEFLSIFIAVIAAFALDNWNDDQRDRNTEINILMEISNGLEKDIEDMQQNRYGHETGIKACDYFRRIANNQTADADSLLIYYTLLTRDFVCIQNTSGYESLKSNGLEIIELDSLRFNIISMYEYDFNLLRKLEEEYSEMQFDENYFQEINAFISPRFEFNTAGEPKTIQLPLHLDDKDRNVFLTYLWKIEGNRQFIIKYYKSVEEKLRLLNKQIKEELNG